MDPPADAPPLPPTGAGRRFVRHVFVCTSGSACDRDGPASEIRSRLKELVADAGLRNEVRVNKAGCLGQCGHGPMVVVYPEGVWYSHVGLGDAQELFREHLVAGRPVERLRFRTPSPGTNVVPKRHGPLGPEPDPQHPAYEPCGRCPPP